jgi:hypothetical protein
MTDIQSVIKECHAVIGSLYFKLQRANDRIADLEAALRRCHDDKALLISTVQKDVATERMAPPAPPPAAELIPDDAPELPATEHDTTKEIRIFRSTLRVKPGENPPLRL